MVGANLRRESAGGGNSRRDCGGHLGRCVGDLNGDLVDDDDCVDRDPDIDNHRRLTNNLNGLDRDDRGTLVHGPLKEVRDLRVGLGQGAASKQTCGRQQAPGTSEMHGGQVNRGEERDKVSK